ncbi:hypothetical protein PIB30_088116 [Stylosanthes scabra]|uniref:Uncharacterized protein n=1 Tax=Stylosanthes scabra TaxID=79078 RepID=A0ABU6XTT8_9FABA|nr:hypothetical protein [Stylosanthes scabra]
MARTTPIVRYCRKLGRQPAGPHLSLRLTSLLLESILKRKNRLQLGVAHQKPIQDTSESILAHPELIHGPSFKPFQKQNRFRELPNRFAATFSNHFLLYPLMNRFWNPSNRLETLRKLFQEKDHRQKIDSEGLESIHTMINKPLSKSESILKSWESILYPQNPIFIRKWLRESTLLQVESIH